jgi:competence protein ComEC
MITIGLRLKDRILSRKVRAFGAILFLSLLLYVNVFAAPSGVLQIHLLDVGQADCILIQTPGGKNMLVDAGNNDDADFITGYLVKQGVRTLQVIVGTHPHEDHIGGMAQIINRFAVDRIYLPKVTTATRSFEALLLAIKNKGLRIKSARGGDTIGLDPAVSIRIFAPNSDVYRELNNYSVVLKLTYGRNSILLTGDAEAVSETEMLQKHYPLKADLLKVGHHGSANSTTEEFLAAVAPKVAAISVGKGNPFKHPHRETLQRLKKGRVKVYRTDKSGTIRWIGDGKTLKKIGK